MVKIKTKKQKNLPQLIEWAWENPKLSRNKRFVSENKDSPYVNQYVIFNEVGYAEIENSYCYGRNDLFTVTVEEEIDEETKLDYLLDHFINPYGQHYVGNIYHNRSINDVLEENDEMEIATNSIHFFDKETKEFKLIWSNGKLIENKC